MINEKQKKYHTAGTATKFNQKIIETVAKLISLTHIHDLSLSWLGTGSSI
jgi:hypothetical protein